MKKIIKLSTLCLLCTTLLSAEDKSFITKTTENVTQAIENNKIYNFYAHTGITNLKRDVNSINVDSETNTLYEVEAGVVLLPGTYDITLSYKTSFNNESTTDLSGNSIDSKAKNFTISANLLSNKDYGYIDFEYSDIVLNGVAQRVGSNDTYILTRAGAANGYKAMNVGDKMQTEEKLKTYTLGYRLPMMPNVGIVSTYVDRSLPAILDGIDNKTYIVENMTGTSLMYGIGYFDNLRKAPKNKPLLTKFAYMQGDLKTSGKDVKGINYDSKGSLSALMIEAGYKFSNFELLLGMKYANKKVDSNAAASTIAMDESELFTTVSIGMQF